MALHEASRQFHCSSIRTVAEVSWHLTMSHLGLYHSQRSRVSLAPFSPWATQVALVVKNLPANAGDVRDMGSIPGSGRSPGGGHGNPVQYSCLQNLHWPRSLAGCNPYGHIESDPHNAFTLWKKGLPWTNDGNGMHFEIFFYDQNT